MATDRLRLSARYWIAGLTIFIGIIAFARLASVTKASGSTICGDLGEEIPESQLGFRLPRSVDGLISACDVSDTNLAVKVRFNMAPDELEAFMQKTGLAKWQTKAETRAPISYLDPSYVARMQSYVYADDSSGTDATKRILIDVSNVNQFTVYVDQRIGR